MFSDGSVLSIENPVCEHLALTFADNETYPTTLKDCADNAGRRNATLPREANTTPQLFLEKLRPELGTTPFKFHVLHRRWAVAIQWVLPMLAACFATR